MTGGPAIIIFGAAVRPDGSPSGALRARVKAAAALGARFPAPQFVPTGGQGRYGPAEALVMRDLLIGSGAAPDAITVEPTGRNTLRSAQACARLLRGESRPVLVVTSGYHMARCVCLLRLLGLNARPGMAAAGSASRSFRARWYWRLREVPALACDSTQALIWRLRRTL